MPAPSTPPDARSERAPGARSPWKWALRLVLGAAVVWLLARSANAAPLEGIRRAPPSLLAACVAAYWLGQALSARRWQILLRSLAPEAGAAAVSWSECLSWYGAGMFWNLWMPTGLGGDAARSILAGRRVGDGASGALSVLLDRALGLASLLALALIALAVDSGLSHSAGSASGSIHMARRVLLGSTSLGAVLVGALWAASRWARARPRSQGVAEAEEPRGWKRKLAGTAARVAAVSAAGQWRRARVLAPALGLSLGVQAIQIGINIALARAVGLGLEPGSMAWVVPVLALSSVVPLGIGGLGAREAGAVALLGAAFGSGDVLAWSLLWQAVVWLSSLLGAPLAWRWRHFERAST